MINSDRKTKRKVNSKIKREMLTKLSKVQTSKKQNWQSKCHKPSKDTIKAFWTSTHKNMYFKNYKSIAARRCSSQGNMNIVIKHQITILIKVTINSSIREFSKSRMSLKTIMIYLKLALKLRRGLLITLRIYLLNRNRMSIRWTLKHRISKYLPMAQMKKMI